MTVYPPVSTLCDRWIYAAPSSERFLSFQGSKRQKDVSVSLSPETPNYVAKSKLSLQCVFLDASLGCGCPHACVRGHEFTLLAVPSQRLTDSYFFPRQLANFHRVTDPGPKHCQTQCEDKSGLWVIVPSADSSAASSA